MVVPYSIFILITGLSFAQSIYDKDQTVKDGPSEPLALDEAYVIVKNNNCSDDITLLGSPIVCEYCDLDEIVTVPTNRNATQIINTEYAYDLEVRLRASNMSSLCIFKSYKFAEHGTYVFDIRQVAFMTSSCSIKQIGNPSNYSAPAIVGILFLVLYTILVEVGHRLYYRGYFNRFRPNNVHQKLINENVDTVETSRQNIQQGTTNEVGEITIGTTNNANELSPDGGKRLSDKKADNKQVLPKRLRGLDTFRGFSLMVMIFVNYGGMFSIACVKKTN
jgi:hypothetical protein